MFTMRDNSKEGSVDPEIVIRTSDTLTKYQKRRCCNDGPRYWCKKYFWEGQDLKKPLDEDRRKLIAALPVHKRVLANHKRIIGFLLPGLFIHFFWWAIMIDRNLWYLFPLKYAMTITMIFGSMIAGMTSEGGGAIAFPVMTLVLGINPSIARDFSLMIQSCGMSAAAFTIFFMRVRLEWHSLIVSSLGGLGGVIFGLEVVDPKLTPPMKKLGFVSIWFAFASVLLFLNRVAKRKTFKSIPNFNWWKFLVLLAFGFLGGIFTSFAGSGIDICSFMILTLLFRVTEKVATPTSVILMAFNTILGFYWRGVMQHDIDQEAWDYLVVCVPVVVIGAPLGSLLGSHFHRLVLAALVIFIDVLALVTAFSIIRPLTNALIGGCVGIIVGCFIAFMLINFAGEKLLDRYEKNLSVSNDHEKITGLYFNPSANSLSQLVDDTETNTHVDLSNTHKHPRMPNADDKLGDGEASGVDNRVFTVETM